MFGCLPQFKLAYLSYTALLAALFLFTAWRAIETDLTNIETPGVQRSDVTGEVDASQPKTWCRQAPDQMDILNLSRQEELLTFCRNIRKFELYSEGQKGLDLLLLGRTKNMIPPQSLRLTPYDRFESSFKKFPVSGLVIFKSREKSRYQNQNNCPAKIDIPLLEGKGSSNRNGRIRGNHDLLYSIPPHLAAGDFLFDNCFQYSNLQCGQIVSGTNIYQDTSTISLRDCNNNLFYNYRGVVWYHLIGTGDQMRVIGSSSGDNAEMHLYYGSCDTLNCVGGAYGINTGERIITTTTIAGQHYYIMLANYNTPAPNMTYQLKIECCSNNPLFYSPPNNFDSTSVIIVRSNNTITANNYIGKGASVTYNGALGVYLNPGFEVAKEAVFQADVNGCLIVPGSTSAGDDPGGNPSPHLPAGFINEKMGPLIKEETTIFEMDKQ